MLFGGIDFPCENRVLVRWHADMAFVSWLPWGGSWLPRGTEIFEKIYRNPKDFLKISKKLQGFSPYSSTFLRIA